MPARKKPVKKRNAYNPDRLVVENRMSAFKMAAINEEKKKILEGEYRSAIEKIANTKVPVINPNWINEVKFPTELASAFCKISGITGFTTNHKEVPAN